MFRIPHDPQFPSGFHIPFPSTQNYSKRDKFWISHKHPDVYIICLNTRLPGGKAVIERFFTLIRLSLSLSTIIDTTVKNNIAMGTSQQFISECFYESLVWDFFSFHLISYEK